MSGQDANTSHMQPSAESHMATGADQDLTTCFPIPGKPSWHCPGRQSLRSLCGCSQQNEVSRAACTALDGHKGDAGRTRSTQGRLDKVDIQDVGVQAPPLGSPEEATITRLASPEEAPAGAMESCCSGSV